MSNLRAGGGGGISKGISLANTVHSEVAPCLPLPSLPVFCGALDQDLRLIDEPTGSVKKSKRTDVADQASKISKLLQATDVSYLNLRTEVTQSPYGREEHLDLYNEVLRCNSEAFEHTAPPGSVKEQMYNNVVPKNKVSERKLFVQNLTANNEAQKDKVKGETRRKDKGETPQKDKGETPYQHEHFFPQKDKGETPHQHEHFSPQKDKGETPHQHEHFSPQKDKGEIPHQHEHDAVTSSSRKPKSKKKTNDDTLPTEPEGQELQDAAVGRFCEILEDLCGKAEVSLDDREEGEAEWLLLPVGNIRTLVKEVISSRASKILHFVPVGLLERILKILDHHIHTAEGLSITQTESSFSDVVSTIMVALESIHAAIAIMAYNGMPKQIYREEIIERMVEFSRRQIADIMSACDPNYRSTTTTTTKPIDNGGFQDEDDDDDDDYDEDFGSASKKRRRSGKVKRSGANKISAAAHNILQKLCTILGFLKDLLMIERLSDSCILQLVKTCFSTLLVDNVQILQLQAISLIGAIFYSYTQHRVYVMDDLLHLLLKIPLSKRIPRTYHLADEEQRQIQMITALLIQLIHCSANLPNSLREAPDSNPLFEIGIDSSYPDKSQEAVTDACCLFWSRVLQRFANTKNQNQDASEFKVMLENLVMDLLTTLNLPEYPASAHILEVLCVLLLQNAGLKSKDVTARSIAIDVLGTIAARLKREAVLCKKENFWIVKELRREDERDISPPDGVCSVCLDAKNEKSLVECEGCERFFHVDCMGIREHEVSGSSWLCQICLCKKQLLFLQSYCKSQGKVEGGHNRKKSKSSEVTDVTKTEIVQQMLLNYLQDSGSAEDVHIFTRWFYICLWYKDDPSSEENFLYYLARLKSKAIVRGSGMVSSLLTRNSIKKITLALGQNNSFSRGFDKILHLLLVSLREGSPVIRAKALRAVSIIVEADPEVLGDNNVQKAVEGRFCDSAISVREAALELVGRYIASHPDVALRYFGKVAERVKDTGVSVRKRAIKIIKDMCSSNSSFTEFNSACIEIISRISDEESSIQDLVCKTFYEFWFEEPTGSQNQMYADGSSVTLEIAKKTEQMVEMLRKRPNYQSLVIVIKRNLALDFLPQSAKAVGISPVMIASVRKRCELMCKCLLEKILRVEEANNNDKDVGALHYVLLLHAFCVVNPALCAPATDPSQFVVTLQPYLKKQAVNRAVAQLVESIVFVIDSVLPLVRKLPQSVIEDLEQDLKQMIVRHSFLTVVHACIKCLCSMSKVAGKGASVIGYLIQVFFKRLDSLGFENNQQVGRSLFCLGLLIRYGSTLLRMSLSGKQTLDVSGSLTLFKKYFYADDFSLKIRSLQALGYVLIAKPECMLEKEMGNILESTLSSNADARLKMQSLQNLFEYLVDSEHQMENDKAETETIVNNSKDASCVPVAAGAGDTNICGGIIQLYWNSILGRCLDGNDQVRQSALKIVEIVLRQGLVHPITCVPYLIALETDPQEANSKLAHHLLMNMNEKYPSFFESRLGDGLQMSFIFIQAMNQNSPETPKTKTLNNPKTKSDGSSFSYARLGVSRIYKVIRGNRASRNKFMSSIVRKFDTPRWHNSVVTFLIYCTEILSLLPFVLPEEPLYLIYAINRVIQVRAGTIEANMKSFLHMLQEQNRKEPENGNVQVEVQVQQEPIAPPVSGEDMSVDKISPVKEEIIPSEVKEEIPNEIKVTETVPMDLDQQAMNNANPIVISPDDLPHIQGDCLAACALQLLLKLKRHLKIIYNLDDARCQAFSPADPPKPGEFLSKQNIPFNVGEIDITRPTTYEEILERYQVFKNALREDTVDYSVYTANIKRKRPPGRKPGTTKATPTRITNGNNNDSDSDGDENWGSGTRITSGSKSRINTRSRLRL